MPSLEPFLSFWRALDALFAVEERTWWGAVVSDARDPAVQEANYARAETTPAGAPPGGGLRARPWGGPPAVRRLGRDDARSARGDRARGAHPGRAALVRDPGRGQRTGGGRRAPRARGRRVRRSCSDAARGPPAGTSDRPPPAAALAGAGA